MRSQVILVVLVVLFVALGVHLVARPLPARVIASAEPIDATDESLRRGAAAGRSPHAADGGPPDAPASRPPRRSPAEISAEAARELETVRDLDRPLRVIGLGWELVAPGAWANDGLSPGPASRLSSKTLQVHFSVAADPLAVERALAEGGRAEGGADVAIVPLQTLAAIYDDLEPLLPEVFLVTGWSRGQHELLTRGGAWPPEVGEGGEVVLGTRAGSPAHDLALVALELSGVAPGQVRVVDPAGEEAGAATLLAVEAPPRGGSARGGLEPFLTTERAGRVIPYVAFAPRRFVEAHGRTLERFSLAWVRASEEIMGRVPEAARRLGAIDGAPEALELLGPMVRWAPASLAENARLAGLAGRDALTLELLFSETRRRFAAAGVIAAPEPGPAPISRESIAAIVAAGLTPASPRAPTQALAPSGDPESDAPGGEGTVGEPDAAALLFVPGAALGGSEAVQVERIGLLADMFAPAPLRLRRRGAEGAALETAIGVAAARFEWPPGRALEPAAGPATGVEISSLR